MQDNAPTAQQNAAQPKGLKKIFSAVWRFIKKHKVLDALAIIAIVIAIVIGNVLRSASAAAAAAGSYSFIRTTTLEKGDLTDTVSATGTVESADTSTVTYTASGTAATPKFKTVNVAVGDTVSAGDVIATLDTSDIEESIADEKERLADNVSKAKTSVDEAQTAYTKATDAAATAETTLTSATNALTSAQSAFQTAQSSVSTFQSNYNAAAAAEAAALVNYNSALAANSGVDSTVTVATAQSEYQTAYNAWNVDDTSRADAVLTATCNAKQLIYNVAVAKEAYTNAQAATRTASVALDSAKSSCNYDACDLACTQAEAAKSQARTALDQAEANVTSTKKALDSAKETLEDASTSDTLKTLNEQLADCSLKAETSGKVTSLNASVGSAPSAGTAIATIQNTDSLKVSITVSESDINKLTTGMACQITTDATENTISGTLTQIDPVADQSGSFGAEVTVNDANTALKIGMNATVKVVLSSTADCFTVPLDAIGNDDDGTGDYVLRKTGGEGTDMTFEKVSVTTGSENDYYVEISSNDLAEGDVIRSSADLTQGIVTTSETSDLASLMGPQQGTVTVTTDDSAMHGNGGGTPPDGGNGGGPGGM